MARIRTIKPEMPGSATLARCSRDARLLFVWLITDADDVGRVAGSAKRLAGSLYPHDGDVSEADVNRWVAELEAVDLLSSYWVKGVRYLALSGWSEHQRINKPTPSRLPPPDNADPTPPESPGEVPEESAASMTSPNGNVRELPRISPGSSRGTPESSGPNLGAFGPRSTSKVQGPSFQTEVDLVGKSLVRAPDGFAPDSSRRNGDAQAIGASLGHILGKLR